MRVGIGMTANQFREALATRLQQRHGRAVLRIALAHKQVIEFDGPALMAQSQKLAERCKAPQSSVVLLLLPHSPELFLLHIGLILSGRIPAILAWPTSRIDPEKYQRNLIHQLRNLPAA